MAKAKEKNIAVKSNHLIESSYRLTIVEWRVVNLAISKLYPQKPMHLQRSKKVYANEYAEIFGVDMKNAYNDIKQASDRLLVRLIKTFDKDPKKQGYHKFQWASHVYYEKKKGFVEITFHELIDPYLTMLSTGEYAKINVERLAGVRSMYTARLYELMRQYKIKGERFIMLDSLRKWFELEDSYKLYSALKRRVLEPALKELQEKTDLIIKWKEIKKGRKVVGFNFTFRENEQLDMFKG